MPQDTVKILMGLHPHTGWRSFKTSKDVSILEFGDQTLVVYDQGRIAYTGITTPFGRLLRNHLAHHEGLVSRIRFGRQQFELFLPQTGPSWEEQLPHVLLAIAVAYNGSLKYELEIRDMSGGEPSWDAAADVELEEIEELSDSFLIK